MTIWRNLTVARMAGLDQSSATPNKNKELHLSCERWDIYHTLGLLRSLFEIGNCAASKFCAMSQQLTASKDISA